MAVLAAKLCNVSEKKKIFSTLKKLRKLTVELN